MRNITLFTLIIVLAISSISLAAFNPIGDPVEGNSWSQLFQSDGGNWQDLLAVRVSSSDPKLSTLESSALHSFSNDFSLLWENAPQYPTIASASGTRTDSSYQFKVKFPDPKSAGVVIDLVGFDGDTITESTELTYSGGWNVTGTNVWMPSRSDVVPEPTTIGLLGLGALSLVRRRRRA